MTSLYNNPYASYGSSLYTSNLGALDRSSSIDDYPRLYGTSRYGNDDTDSLVGNGSNKSKAELLRQNRILKAQLLKLKEEADEPSKDLLGLDRLFTNGKNGGVGITDMLIGAVIPGLLKGFGGGKDGDGGLFGG